MHICIYVYIHIYIYIHTHEGDDIFALFAWSASCAESAHDADQAIDGASKEPNVPAIPSRKEPYVLTISHSTVYRCFLL